MNTRRLLLVSVVTLLELSATSHLAKANQPKTARTPFAVRQQMGQRMEDGKCPEIRGNKLAIP